MKNRKEELQDYLLHLWEIDGDEFAPVTNIIDICRASDIWNEGADEAAARRLEDAIEYLLQRFLREAFRPGFDVDLVSWYYACWMVDVCDAGRGCNDD